MITRSISLRIHSSSTSTAWHMVGQSDFEPMMTPTRAFIRIFYQCRGRTGTW